MTEAVPREVRRFVWNFEEVQSSRVMLHNLPPDARKEFGKGADDESLLVDIRRRPAE